VSIRSPVAAITVDGTELTAAQAGLSSVVVDVGLGPAHDRARMAFGWASPVADVQPGASLEVALGYDDAPETVLTGDVDEVSRRAWGLVVDALARPARLIKARVGRSFVGMPAGNIVRDLIAEADVDAGEVDAGPTLAAFHVDERAHIWAHLLHLSRIAFSELSTAGNGDLNFRLSPGAEAGLGGLAGAAVGAVSGAASSLLGIGGGRRFGAEIHEMAVNAAGALTPAPTVAPFGAASELGPGSWHVLVKDPVGASPAGSVLIPASLRDRDASAQLEGSLRAAAERAATAAWVTVTGDPTIRAGDTVQLTELPGGGDVSVRVTRLEHRFSRTAGFVTRIEAEGAPT
jgi:hypothetical protein